MEKGQPELSSISSDPVNLEEGDQLKDSDPRLSVIVWDHQRSRYQMVAQVISQCGARPHWLEEFSAIQDVQCSVRCSIALVALGPSNSPSDLSLEIIRLLKHKGFKIISYEQSALTWPLGLQCQALLAGSLRLLDSAKAEFREQLQRMLTRLLRSEAHRWDEEKNFKNSMKELGIVGDSQTMMSIFRWIRRASKLSDLPILITGETGTGKEIMAHAIYHLDPKRCKGPFVALNCGAINPSLVESELFGHRRGAFTGADRDRQGLVRSAHGGILFLDEIGELSDTLQTKLLRVLQEGRVLGVGEDEDVRVSVRIIAATNRDLAKMVSEKKFRADLFHRLNVLSVHIPPLRERPIDLKPQIEHFLAKYRSLNPLVFPSVTPEFVEALTAIELPGNTRQIENVVRQALLNKMDDTPLDLSDLPVEIWQQLSERRKSPFVRSEQGNGADEIQKATAETPQEAITSYFTNLLDSNSWSLSRSLRHCERLFLEAALHATRGNQSKTARLLGITPRSIYNKLRKHHLQA